MPIQLPAEVQQARQAATTSAGRANELAAYQPKVEDVLKQKALDAYGANQDLIPQLDVATQSYLEAPQVGREQYQDIFNPFQREALVSQYTGQQSLPMLSLGSVLGQRFGRVDDIIGAGGRAFESAALTEQARAQQEGQNYQNLLNEYVTLENLRQSERGLDISEADAGGGGGIDLSGVLSLLAMGGMGETGGAGGYLEPTEPMPNYNPGPVSAVSPNGEWFWDFSSGEWIPIGD